MMWLVLLYMFRQYMSFGVNKIKVGCSLDLVLNWQIRQSFMGVLVHLQFDNIEIIKNFRQNAFDTSLKFLAADWSQWKLAHFL